jgi:hypothetical protein
MSLVSRATDPATRTDCSDRAQAATEPRSADRQIWAAGRRLQVDLLVGLLADKPVVSLASTSLSCRPIPVARIGWPQVAIGIGWNMPSAARGGGPRGGHKGE